MRIGISLIHIPKSQIDGAATVAHSLVNTLPGIDRRNQYVLFATPENVDMFEHINNWENFKTVLIKPLPDRAMPVSIARKLLRLARIWPEYTLASQARREKVDLIYYPGPAVRPEHPQYPCVVTVHCLQHELYPEFFPATLEKRKQRYRLSIQRAWRIIAVSEFTKKAIVDIHKVPEDRIRVIHNGVSDIFLPRRGSAEVTELARKYHLPRVFAFYPASPLPCKNHLRLAEAISVLKKKYDLVCPLVLTGFEITEHPALQNALERLHLSQDVIVLGRVPVEEIPLLYNAASLLIFPSLHEGFGLPVVEAMASGCPVVCSNTTSLPEVAGNAAVLVYPFDVSAIAEAIAEIIINEKKQTELVRKGLRRAKKFSWEKVARETIQVYNEVFQLIKG